MRFQRVRAIAKKELIQIWRDPLSLAMAFLLPVILLFLFGYAITLDVNNLSTVVYDLDKSRHSREFIYALTESGYFTVISNIDAGRDIDWHLNSGKARIAVAIPRDFSNNIRAGKDAVIQAIVDGSDSNMATIAIGYLSGVSGLYSEKIAQHKTPPLIEPRVRVWYNNELKSRNFIIPGLISVIIAILASLLTSLAIAREWERGTLEQLISTPVKTTELISGKLSPYFLIGFIDVIISVLIGVFMFGVPLKGSVFLLMLLSSLFLFGGLSLGLLISIIAKSQIVASQVAMVASYLPAFLLSGFMFSISNMPKPLQIITHIIPARYYVAIVKGIFLKGSTLKFLIIEALFLSAFSLLVFLLATITFRKRIE
jgi:ABC-2 type transport system permease protein